MEAERYQLIKKFDISDHIKVNCKQYQGLSGIIKNFVEENQSLIVEFKADVTNEYIDKSYKILTDDC